MSRQSGVLESWFQLSARGTTAGREVMAGLTTFMTMAYIIFVNPSILSAAGMPKEAIADATIIAAALMCLAMGFISNYPFALASGMGLNAVVAFSIVTGSGYSFATAMGMIVVEGLVVFILVLTNLRQAVMNAIPLALKRAIGIGIGLFIAFIGLQDGSILQATPATFVTMASLATPQAFVTAAGVVIIAWLMARRVQGAILLGIIASTILALIVGVTHWPAEISAFTFKTDTMFAFTGADWGAIFSVAGLSVVFALMLSDFFDTMGTVVAIGGQAGFTDKSGRLPGLNRVLGVDAIAAAVGGVLGASSVTTYIESASGVAAGGRTGLTSVVTGLLFLLALLIVPIVGVIPSQATAPALIVVGFLMMSVIKDIDFSNIEESLPAFVTLIGIPLTFSIADGIGWGFISYVAIKLLGGKFREVHPALYVVAALFFIDFVWV
ncbi:MAG TPA: NCS2 family permease [Limnochordia bacterium]|nr:NCS2 family permease [Limnochordia bacterium]